MKRAYESTVTIRVRSAADAAGAVADVCIPQKSLEASSPLLAAVASDLDEVEYVEDVTLNVKVDDEWAVPIMANLLKNREEWTPKNASDYIFKDETSLTTERSVNLYHALDKYEMTWAMEAFHARFVQDIQVGLVDGLSIFAAYREHPCIARFLIGLGKAYQKMAPITSAQLKMLLLNKGVNCALIVSEAVYNLSNEYGYKRLAHCDVDIIFKIPKKYCGEPASMPDDDDDSYIPRGDTGSWIREYCERTRLNHEYGQWLKIILRGASHLRPDDWLMDPYYCTYEDTEDDTDGEGNIKKNMQIYRKKKLHTDLDEVCDDIKYNIGTVISSTGETIHKSDYFEFHAWPYDKESCDPDEEW